MQVFSQFLREEEEEEEEGTMKQLGRYTCAPYKNKLANVCIVVQEEPYIRAGFQCSLAEGQQHIAAWCKQFLQYPLSLLSLWFGQNSDNSMYGIHDNKRLGAFQTVPQFLTDERDKEAICKKKSSLFKWSVGGLDSHTEREKNSLNVVLGSRTKEQVKSFILQTLVSNVMAEFYRRAMREIG